MPAPTEPATTVAPIERAFDSILLGIRKALIPGNKATQNPQPIAAAAIVEPEVKMEVSPKAKGEIKQEKKKGTRRKTASVKTFEKKVFQANLLGAEVISRSHSTSDTNTTTVNLKSPTVLEQLPEMNFKLSKETLTAPSGNLKAIYKYHADGSGSSDDLRFEEQDLIAEEMRQFSQKIKDAKKNGQKPCLDAIWIGDFNVSPYEIKDEQVVINPKFLAMLQRAFPGGVFNIGLPSYAVIKTRGALDAQGNSLGLSPLNQQSEKDGEENFDAKTIVVHIKFNEDGEAITNDPQKIVEDKIKQGIDIKHFDADYTGLKDHPYALLEDEGIVYAAWGNMSTQGFKGFSKPSDKYQEDALENGSLKKSTVEAGVNAIREFAFLLSQNFSPLLAQPAGEVKLDTKQTAALARVRKDFTIERNSKVSVPFTKAFTHIMTAKRKELNLEGLENTWKELEKKRGTVDFTDADAIQMLELEPKITAVAREIAAEKQVLEGLLITTLTAWFDTEAFKAMKKTLKTKFGDTPEEQGKFIKKMAAGIYKATKGSLDPFLKDLDGQTTAGYMPWVNGIQAAFDNALVDEMQAEATARLINAIHQSRKVGYLVETEAYVAKECLFYEMPTDALDLVPPLEVKSEDVPVNYYNQVADLIAAKITEYYPNDPQNNKQVFVLHNDELYYINVEDNNCRWIPRPKTPKDLEEYNTLKSRCVSGCVHSLMELHDGEDLEDSAEITDMKKIIFIKNTEENTWWITCADGTKPPKLQQIRIDNEGIVRLLDAELIKGKPSIKNLASLNTINAYLADLRLNYACNDMNIKNANKLDSKDKDLIFNVSGATVRGSKDDSYNKALTAALTRFVGADFEDEKSTIFQIDKQLGQQSHQEFKLEPANIHLPPVPVKETPSLATDMTPKANVRTGPVVRVEAPSAEEKDSFLILPPSPQNNVHFSPDVTAASSSSSSSVVVPDDLNSGTVLLGGTFKRPRRAQAIRSPSKKEFVDLEVTPPRAPKLMSPNLVIGVGSQETKQFAPRFLFSEIQEHSFEDHTLSPWVDLELGNNFHVHRTEPVDSPVILHETHFSDDEMAALTLTKIRPLSGQKANSNSQPNPPRDDFPEITRFRATEKELRVRGYDRDHIEQWKLEALTKFLEEFDRLNTEDLSNEDMRDLMHLCVSVANCVYDEQTKQLPFGEELENLESLVKRLSERSTLTKICMGAALLVLGCAFLASLSLVSLGIPVVAAAATATIATYTVLSTTALIGIGVGSAIVSGLASFGLYKLTKPKFSDIAHCADEIETDKIAMDM